MAEDNDNKNITYDLEWTVHPVKRRPMVSMSVTLFIFLVGVVINFSTHSQVFTILALVVLFGSLAKFYFPTSYAFNEKEVFIKTTTQTLKKSWSQYRSFHPDKNGVLLSPYLEQNRMENFRGTYIMFENNREQVLEYIKNHINTKVEEPQAQKDGDAS